MNEFIDRFNSIPLTQKILVLVVVMVGGFAAFFMLVYTPMNDEIQAKEMEAQELQRDQSRLESQLANMEDMDEQLRELNQRLQMAQETLPESSEIPDLLQTVYRHAQTAGLSIETFQRLDENQDGEIVEIPVEMELVGTFDEVADFFSFVGGMTRLINIEGVQMSVESSGMDSDGVLNVTAQATTYRWAN